MFRQRFVAQGGYREASDLCNCLPASAGDEQRSLNPQCQAARALSLIHNRPSSGKSSLLDDRRM